MLQALVESDLFHLSLVTEEHNGDGPPKDGTKVLCLLLCRQEPTCYDEMRKKEIHNLRVRDGRCCKLPYDLQPSDRGNAGCFWIHSAREFVDATVPRHQVLLQVRNTVNRHTSSFIHSV